MPPAFAGFTLTDRLSVDAFGETWTATGPAGKRARVRRIEASLGKIKTFATWFLASNERLAPLVHPNVVATIAVGRDPEGALVVVTEDVESPITLETVLRDARVTGHRPPPQLAVHIARQAAYGLARAHQAGMVHGGVHPRNVLIDGRGEVRLAEFALSRALAAAASEDDSLLRGLLGYVAPELALGDPPEARCDVFGCGALLHELCTGSPPPGLVEGPVALLEVCERALATDREARYHDAGELATALDAVAAQLPLGDTGARSVARFLAETRGAAEKSIDAASEDMLADLIGDLGDADATREDTPLPAPLPYDRNSDGFRALIDDPLNRGASSRAGEPEPEPEFTPTKMREPHFAGSVDVSIDSAARPLPSAPVAARVQTSDIIGEEMLPPLRAPTPTPVPQLRAPTPAPLPRAPTPAPLPRAPTPAPVRTPTPASAPAPALVLPVPVPGSAAPPPDHDISKSHTTLWLLTGVAIVGTAALILTQTDLLHPGRRQAEEREAQGKIADAQRAFEVGKVRRADIVVDSDPPEAAVWLLIGRTPADSVALPTASIYELRVEQQGYESADLTVTPGRWSGSGEAMRAALRVSLKPAAADYRPAATPPEPPPAESAAKAGSGTIHVDSDPPGAQVWLLVGFTPSVRVTNLAADRDYELKLTLDGHVPGFVSIKAADFINPTGATRPEVARQATLAKTPK